LKGIERKKTVLVTLKPGRNYSSFLALLKIFAMEE
jgi:hypothetical protein